MSYVHKTTNHLVFDKLRAIGFELDLLNDHLKREESGRIGGAGLQSEIDTLDKISVLLFDDVYKSLRDKWS